MPRMDRRRRTRDPTWMSIGCGAFDLRRPGRRDFPVESIHAHAPQKSAGVILHTIVCGQPVGTTEDRSAQPNKWQDPMAARFQEAAFRWKRLATGTNVSSSIARTIQSPATA